MKSLALTSLLGAFLGVFLLPAAQAQTPLSPRVLGMGGSYVAVARGQEALQFTPASVTLPEFLPKNSNLIFS